MNHRVGARFGEHGRHKSTVADVSDPQGNALRHEVKAAGRQIVHDDHIPSGIAQREHRMRTDISRSARHDDAA
jgi:hypothetical protein